MAPMEPFMSLLRALGSGHVPPPILEEPCATSSSDGAIRYTSMQCKRLHQSIWGPLEVALRTEMSAAYGRMEMFCRWGTASHIPQNTPMKFFCKVIQNVP